MRRRLSFVLPDLASAIRTANDLLLARMEDRHLHFLGRGDMSLGELHAASCLQKSDLKHSLPLGAGIGALSGLLLGVHLKLTLIGGLSFDAGTILLCVIGGAMSGSRMSTTIGLSVPSVVLKPCAQDIEQGRIVLMVDVPAGPVEEIRALAGQRHPEAVDRGEDPAIPVFP